MVHWVQDFYHVPECRAIVEWSEHTFKAQLERALARAKIVRKTLDVKSTTASKAADPGPLKKRSSAKIGRRSLLTKLNANWEQMVFHLLAT
jgi:hypothetical protein